MPEAARLGEGGELMLAKLFGHNTEIKRLESALAEAEKREAEALNALDLTEQALKGMGSSYQEEHDELLAACTTISQRDQTIAGLEETVASLRSELAAVEEARANAIKVRDDERDSCISVVVERDHLQGQFDEIEESICEDVMWYQASGETVGIRLINFISAKDALIEKRESQQSANDSRIAELTRERDAALNHIKRILEVAGEQVCVKGSPLPYNDVLVATGQVPLYGDCGGHTFGEDPAI